MLAVLLAGCASATLVEEEPADAAVPETPSGGDAPVDGTEQRIAGLIDQMSPREQVEQLFMISLGPKDSTEYTAPGAQVSAFLDAHSPGGYIFFAGNITTVEDTRVLIDAIKDASAVAPLFGIDEEGGRISRLSGAKLPGYTATSSAASIGASGDPQQAYDAAATIGATLHAMGFTMDFAPDADVLTNPGNTVIGDRAFSDNAAVVSEMVSAFQRGLRDAGILCGPKHFPGHGGTTGDSHTGMVRVDYDADHLTAIEYAPFVRAIDEGAAFVLVGHILAPNADDSGLPASLSPYFVTDVLRGQLGFDGIVITDAMDMGAVAEQYPPDEAAVRAILAGVDIVLMPADYDIAVDGVLRAVESGRIPAERIRESLTRILRTKIEAGIL